MPIVSFDTLDQIPEALRQFAAPDEASGKVNINLVPEARLSEFRDKNIALSKERDELREQVDVLAPIVGEDPEAFKAAMAELRATEQRVKDGTLKESRGVEEEVARRTEDMRKQLEEQVRGSQKEGATWKTKATESDQRYRDLLVTSAIKDAAIDPASGVSPAAIPDILSRAKSTWRAGDDGKVLAYQGDLQLYGADGGSPLTPKEWIGKLKEDAPHYFKDTVGGGAGGGDGKGKVNAFGKTPQDMRSLTAQQRLELANGDPVAQLRKA